MVQHTAISAREILSPTWEKIGIIMHHLPKINTASLKSFLLWDPEKPIADPGIKNAPDPGSATMLSNSDADTGCSNTGSRFFPIPKSGSRIQDPGSGKNRGGGEKGKPPPISLIKSNQWWT
jgi:hypothetical protein